MHFSLFLLGSSASARLSCEVERISAGLASSRPSPLLPAAQQSLSTSERRYDED